MVLDPAVVDAAMTANAAASAWTQASRRIQQRWRNERERTHLLLLYGPLVECCAARDLQVRERLRDVLCALGVEIGLIQGQAGSGGGGVGVRATNGSAAHSPGGKGTPQGPSPKSSLSSAQVPSPQGSLSMAQGPSPKGSLSIPQGPSPRSSLSLNQATWGGGGPLR
jgi:hypothetical protein